MWLNGNSGIILLVRQYNSIIFNWKRRRLPQHNTNAFETLTEKTFLLDCVLENLRTLQDSTRAGTDYKEKCTSKKRIRREGSQFLCSSWTVLAHFLPRGHFTGLRGERRFPNGFLDQTAPTLEAKGPGTCRLVLLKKAMTWFGWTSLISDEVCVFASLGWSGVMKKKVWK